MNSRDVDIGREAVERVASVVPRIRFGNGTVDVSQMLLAMRLELDRNADTIARQQRAIDLALRCLRDYKRGSASNAQAAIEALTGDET